MLLFLLLEAIAYSVFFFFIVAVIVFVIGVYVVINSNCKINIFCYFCDL